jgi:hypothetical protein
MDAVVPIVNPRLVEMAEEVKGIPAAGCIVAVPSAEGALHPDRAQQEKYLTISAT